jgi:ribulose 1,5-bisphosphate carboxylase large subunit-like protein
VIRATYELEPHGAAEELARIESTGLRSGPDAVRARVVSEEGQRAVVEFPEANSGGDATLLVASVIAGEWADSAAFSRCRLVGVEWPEGVLPGPAFEAPEGVLVGAIVKPSLGLSPEEAAETASALARGGADLVKDDELLGDPHWCPLEERVRRVVAAIPEEVRYAANVTGPPESLLARAERVVELGARAVMVNAFAQGFGALVALRKARLGVPLFAHRVGAAFWTRQEQFGVAPSVVADLTRRCGADFVQVGSFTGSVFDSPEEVLAQVAACRAGQPRAVAVLGGGVAPENAAAQVRQAGGGPGLMVLLGSAAYRHPDGVEAAVRATGEAVR